MTLPALPGQGSTAWYPWAAGIHNTVVTNSGGRLDLEVYDDFTSRSDGAIQGVTPAVASNEVWSGTGANPPTVSAGRLVSGGVGYAYVTLPSQGKLIACGVQMDAGSGQPMAMAWVTGGTWDLTNLTGHFSFGPNDFTLTIKRGATFYTVFSGNWDHPLDPAKVHTCAVGIVGDSFVIQVDGQVYVGPPDVRTQTLAGSIVFWEPLLVGGTQAARLSWVAAWVETTSGAPLAPNLAPSDVDLSRGRQGEVVGNHYEMYEATLGRTPGAGQPGISFGATKIVTYLTSAMTLGTTTMITQDAIPPGSTLVIDEAGSASEAATTSGYPTGTGPFTHTLSAVTTAAHAANTVVIATVPSGLRAEMYLNQANNFWMMPNLPVVVFPGENVYLGSDLTQYVTRAAAGVIGTAGVGTGKGAFRPGAWTTANRPTAASVGAGSQGYDTTLSIPIFSDGTSWRNAAGTVV